MTTPDDVGALFEERGNEARRLRVVDDHDVPFSYLAADALEVRGERALIDRTLSPSELPSVAGRAVEAVVDSLRHREELGISGDHQPDRLEPDTAHVAEQGREHLRYAAAVAVELTFTMRRLPINARRAEAASISASTRSTPISGSRRRGSIPFGSTFAVKDTDDSLPHLTAGCARPRS